MTGSSLSWASSPRTPTRWFNNKGMADFFEETLACNNNGKLEKRAKAVGSWMLGDFLGLLNASGEDIEQARVSPKALSQLIDLIDDNTLSGKMAKHVFQEMYETGKSASAIVEEKGPKPDNRHG